MGGNFKVSYKEDMALFQGLWVRTWFAILIGLMLVAPFVVSDYQLSILNEMGIAAIGALGLNLLTGYTGQISLGHGAFLAIGAYVTGIFTTRLNVPFYVALPLSGCMAALLSMIVGIPSLRLKGLYLALGTLAFGFIVEYVLYHWGLTQGDMGMGVGRIAFGDLIIQSERHFYFVIMFFAVLAAFVAKNIARTKIGRSFVAIRDRDTAAEAMGIPLARYKLMAFGLSAFFAGVAGCLTAYYKQWIVPGSFDLSLSIAYIAMIILGGLGTVLGSILGAIMITGIPHAIVYMTDAVKTTFPNLSELIVDFKLGIFGLIIVLTILIEPRGLHGIYLRSKIYWKTWPFKY